MKILHVYTGGGEIYGAERVICNLACEQIKSSMSLEVVYFKRPGRNSFLELLNDSRIPVHVVDSRSRLDTGAFLTLRSICLRTSPHILHSHGYKGDIFLATLKRTLKGPVIVSTKHGSTDATSRTSFYERLGDMSLRYFDRVVAVSEYTKKKLIELHVPERKIEVIHNGIDVSSFSGAEIGSLRQSLNISEDSRVVGFIGRLGPEKGITYLLEAADRICRSTRDVYFVLIGEGILKKETENFVESRKLRDRIIVLGWRKDATDILLDMDMLLLPSLTEGTPMVILEAMAAGVPVIASDVGGIGEIIEDSRTGLLIKPRDPVAIVESVKALLDDGGLAERISRNAAREIESRFSARRMSEKYEKTYLSLMKAKV
ncbi:MAG: glycosyltransferase family 4 protein [Thermodesulfobacteriota bacterium]